MGGLEAVVDAGLLSQGSDLAAPHDEVPRRPPEGLGRAPQAQGPQPPRRGFRALHRQRLSRPLQPCRRTQGWGGVQPHGSVEKAVGALERNVSHMPACTGRSVNAGWSGSEAVGALNAESAWADEAQNLIPASKMELSAFGVGRLLRCSSALPVPSATFAFLAGRLR